MTLRYKIANDQKLHCSFSTLKRCVSPKATIQVVKEMHGAESFSNPHLEFGSKRHEMWRDESLATGQTPQIFRDHLDFQVGADYVEHAFAVEIFKDVVLHFRPDVVALEQQTIVDYKTITGHARQFASSMQLVIYAYGLSMHNIRIAKRVYLCERWDKSKEHILGYEALHLPINLATLGLVPGWLRPRTALLKQANELYLRGEI